MASRFLSLSSGRRRILLHKTNSKNGKATEKEGEKEREGEMKLAADATAARAQNPRNAAG